MARTPKAAKVRAAEPPDDRKAKRRVELTEAEIYRLDILAAHWSLERCRAISRSAVVSELIKPHLKQVVVSVRGGAVAEGEGEAQEPRLKMTGS